MNKEWAYGFDVSGFVHLPGVLTTADVEACNRAIDAVDGNEEGPAWTAPQGEPFRMLMDHPVLKSCLEALCGKGYMVDEQPAMISAGPEAAVGVPLTAGDPERNCRLRYVNQPNGRICHGLRVVWCLEDTRPGEEGIVLVPASHNRRMEPPQKLLSGETDSEMTEEPALAAGDLLLVAETTLRGVRGRPRLVESLFTSAMMMPNGGFAETPAPAWTLELDPEQQVIVGPRTTGRGGTVLSDGQRVRVASEAECPEIRTSGQNTRTVSNPDEVWFWDVRGYLVLRGVMDEAWLTAAHAAIDTVIEAQPDLPEGHPAAFEEVPEAVLRENDWKWPAETSSRIRGEVHRPRIGGLYHLPRTDCDAFRKMIAHPAIVERLNWMLGLGYKESIEPMCCIYPKGTTGGSLHGQNRFDHGACGFLPQMDRVNVLWALNDEAPGFEDNSGGFICIPGSHKASCEIPRPKTTSIDLPQVHKPAVKAGDVLLFGAVAHGTTAWRSPWNRRCVIQFMSSQNALVRPADEVVGWRWSADPANPQNRLKGGP
ncbi:MAG: hypothetical protein CMJ81_18045 [Planctomycetaceae bacterium]|nr:hypothetical protein [Planctomycetaceae bacterium]MBP60036.1 hypothetical protein [Planctomycetaceae bacterium]